VQDFTIVGNSLGDAPWSGYIPITSTYTNGTVYNTTHFGYNNGSWYVLHGMYARKALLRRGYKMGPFQIRGVIKG